MHATDPPDRLTHVDDTGRAKMVDVGAKEITARIAEACGRIELTPEVRTLLFAGKLPKGEALGVARIAGIQAAKDTARLVPLCHQVPLSAIDVTFEPYGTAAVEARARAACTAQTGVEMEALTAVSVALLTIYDMCKALCRGATIGPIELVAKSGGRSGVWRRG